jgi:hypothetical protein
MVVVDAGINLSTVKLLQLFPQPVHKLVQSIEVVHRSSREE